MEEITKITKGLKKLHSPLPGAVTFLLCSGAIFLLALFVSEVKSYRLIGQGIEYRNTIMVSGEGEVFAVPDIAEFSFAVIAEASDVREAQTNVTAKMNAILESIKKAGIPEKDIKTTNYSTQPRYEYTEGKRGSPGTQKLVGYEVAHWVSIKIRDTKKSGDMLALVGDGGATNVSGLSFTIDEEENLRMEARRKAIQDAHDKAVILAKDLNVRIVKLVSFQEYGGPVFYQGFGGAEAVSFKDAASPAPQVPIGENSITANVTLIYAID